MTPFDISTSLEELSQKVADHLFEDARKQIHDIDEQLEEQGVHSPMFMLMALAGLATQMTEYAAYMAAGLYAVVRDEDVAREAVKAILRDQKRAAQVGMDKALEQAEKMTAGADDITKAVDALLKKASKSCH